MSRSDSITAIELRGRQASIGTFGEISSADSALQDRNKLAVLGKKQVLKRRFGFVSLFGFSCCILITWETTLALFAQAFENGGPAGLVWGFLIAWVCSTSVYMCLAEMASIAPIAGGQYFWVSILAPVKYKRFLSYITGWLTTMAWISVLAVGSLFTGTIIQGIINLNNPAYIPLQWQGTLFSWLIIVVGIVVNTVLVGFLPFFESVVLLLHIMGFIAILITMVYLSPKVPASQVFLATLNEGNWPTQGLSFCVGFIGNVATFVGADAAVHMSEEIENAATNVPRAIFITLILNGTLGWAMLIAILFTLTDTEGVLGTSTGFPFIQLFYNGTGLAGATVMTAILIVLDWCAVIGFLATASRMIWSFARDKGLPFHSYISRVDPRTKVPIIAVFLATVLPCLLVLIYIGSTVAYEDVVSLSVSGLYGSYLIPCALLLWRRSTGQIKPHGQVIDTSAPIDTSGTVTSDQDSDVIVEAVLEWGPWRVPGLLGTINNAFACAYCVFVLFWNVWPPATPVDAASMNYSVLVAGGVIIFSVIYYYIWGKREYKGPIIDYEVKGITNKYVVVRDKS